MSSSNTPVWFITATSSGFGKEMALEALRRGHTVVATARRPSSIQDLADAGAHAMAFDVTWPLDKIEAVAADVVARFGRVDYLVNAAGYILEGAVEELAPQELFDQFNTNVFGAMHTIRAFLPGMRAQSQREGAASRATVVTFGSLGSWVGGASYSAYAMTKFCASALAESLDIELAPFGIRGVVVEPGYFRTGFLNPTAKITSKARLPAYNDESTPSGAVRNVLTQVDNNQPGDVKKAGKVLIDILTQTGVGAGRDVPVRIPLGTDCEQTIRKKCKDTLAILDDWQDVVRSTDY